MSGPYNPSLRETMRLVSILKKAGWKRRQKDGVVYYLAPNGVEARSLSKAVLIIQYLGPVPAWEHCGNPIGHHKLHRLSGKRRLRK